tara:strand:+ start:2200 stop:3744 length:1545 start_codon:yes stop_codon:yes gene_type:complete
MGLSSSFTRGLFKGLAQGTTKGVQDAMDTLDSRLSRLSDKRINKITTELPRYKKDLQENEEQIKMLAGLLNTNDGTRGMEVLHSLIVNEGWEKTKVLVPQIHSKLVSNGRKIGEGYMPLSYIDETGDRKIPTSRSLANLITMPLNVPSSQVDDEALKGSGFSLLNMITGGTNNVERYASKRLAQDMAFAGVSKKDLDFKFEKLPTAGKVKIDEFDLQLGKSFASDLKLINARIDSIEMQNDPKNKPELDKLKKLAFKTRTIISNLGEKELSESAVRQNRNVMTDLTNNAFEAKMTLSTSGQWQSIPALKDRADKAISLGNQITDNLKWAHSKGRSDISSKNLGATARGFLTDDLKNKLKNADMLKFDNFAYDPTTFSLIAAENGHQTVRVTKEMIGDGTGAYADLNNGQPYLLIGKKIKITPNLRTEKKTNISNDSAINSDDEQTTTDDFTKQWENLTKTGSSNARKRTLAHSIRNFLLSKGISYSEQELKTEFRTITGANWIDSNFGDITQSN